jgi:fumarate reductase subunit C
MAAPTGPRTHPKQYVRPMPALWWTKRPSYFWFMLRELSSGFLAGYAVFLMYLLSRGKDLLALHNSLEALKSPLSIALHLVVLFFALLNTITTFNLTPKMLVIQKGEERTPDKTISTLHYLVWAIVSLVLFLVIFKA